MSEAAVAKRQPRRRHARVLRFLVGLQASIVSALEGVDGGSFLRDEWQRPEGGGGISRLIERWTCH